MVCYAKNKLYRRTKGLASLAVLIFHIFPCLIFHGIENSVLSKMSFFWHQGSIGIFYTIRFFSLDRIVKTNKREREREGCIIAQKVISRYFRLAIPCLCASFMVYVLVKCGLSFYKYLPESLRFN